MSDICPYCGKRPIKKKRTCGDPECQYWHQLRKSRNNWDLKHRKTDQKRRNRKGVFNVS